MQSQEIDPVYADQNDRELNRLFDQLTRITTWGCLVYIAVVVAFGGDAGRLLAPVLIGISGPVCKGLRHRFNARLGFGAYLWLLFVAMAMQSAFRGGIANPVMHISIVLVLLGGWLLGTRYAAGLMLASVAWASILTYASVYHGWTPPKTVEVVSNWFGISAVWVVGYLVMRQVLTSHNQRLVAIDRLQQNLQEKVEALGRQEEESRLSAQKVFQIMSASPLPITVANFTTGVYIDVNPAWERFFGHRKQDVLGNTSVDLGFWADMRDRQGWIDQFNAEGRVSGHEVTFKMRDGSPRIFMLSSERFVYGEQDCVLTMSVDVTDRKQLESDLKSLNANLEHRVAERTGELNHANEGLLRTMDTLQRAQEELVQSEKLASLGSLVAGVAHELNTPLGNAIMATSALQEAVDSMRREVLAGGIKKSAFETFCQRVADGSVLTMRSVQRAADLVRSFKQVAVDQESERRRTYDLAQVVGEVVDTMRPGLRRQSVDVLLALEPDIAMEGFPGPLGQVLINLIANAEKHAFEGREQRNISVTACYNADRSVHLEVRDDGTGISQKDLGHVFDPFFTTKLGQGGSGLGLSISHRIVTRVLGGQLAVHSEPGRGTCFVMTLPAVAPDVVR